MDRIDREKLTNLLIELGCPPKRAKSLQVVFGSCDRYDPLWNMITLRRGLEENPALRLAHESGHVLDRAFLFLVSFSSTRVLFWEDIFELKAIAFAAKYRDRFAEVILE